MQLYIQWLKSYCLKFFKFLSYGTKWDKLERFQNSYRRYKSLTYSTSQERSNHTIFIMGKGESCYVLKSLTAIWQVTSVWILFAEASNDSCEYWTELIFSKDQRINHFFPLCFFPLNTRNTFYFSCYHLMKSCGFSHGCTSRRAKFCSLLSQFIGYFSSFL